MTTKTRLVVSTNLRNLTALEIDSLLLSACKAEGRCLVMYDAAVPSIHAIEATVNIIQVRLTNDNSIELVWRNDAGCRCHFSNFMDWRLQSVPPQFTFKELRLLRI